MNTTTTPPRSIVIVGAGLAAAEAAKTLRNEGYDGRLTLIGDEARLPYERPPLSKDFLRGETAVEKLLAQPESFYDEQRVELVLGRRATRLDAAARQVHLDDGRVVAFDRALLATGARPRTLTGATPGSRVHLLRTVDDSERLREAAGTASHAIVVGGGWIAAEVAASLRQLGLEVTLVVPGGEVLERALGPEIGRRFTDLHAGHGTRVLRHSRVEAVAADGEVRLSTGETLGGDLVVLGLGAEPNVELARSTGLATADGILVDQTLRTSAPHILAAGDVASARHPRYDGRVRSEHWDNARRQGRTAARNLLGGDETFDRIPFFYSDQFDLGLEFLGRRPAGAELVIRSSADPEAFVALWLEEGRVVAGMHANTWDAKKPIDRLIVSGEVVDTDRLRDPGVPLDALGAIAATA